MDASTRSVAAKVLILSLSELLVRLPIGKAGECTLSGGGARPEQIDGCLVDKSYT